MKVEIRTPKSDCCVVRIGPIARSDPDTELKIAKLDGDGNWQYIVRKFVEGKKKFKFPELEEGQYHVGLFGNKIAAVATTGGEEVPFPFDIFLDPPLEARKIKRVSIQTDGRRRPTDIKPKVSPIALAVNKTLH